MFKKVFTKIKSLFSKEKIEQLIHEEIEYQYNLYNHEFKGIEISINVSDQLSEEILNNFTKEQQELAKKYGVPAFTLPMHLDNIKIEFSVDGIYKSIKYIPIPSIRNFLIKSYIKHEFVHARQFSYLIKNGGTEAMNRWTWYAKTTPYFKNKLEIEAYKCQYFNIQPNLEKTLSSFLIKEEDEIENKVIA